MALRAKIRRGKTEPAGFGGSKLKGDNAAWADFRRNPKRPGQFFPFLRCSSLQ
jgi:hypothetical protein